MKISDTEFNLRYRYRENPKEWFYLHCVDMTPTDLQLKKQGMEEVGWIVELI